MRQNQNQEPGSLIFSKYQIEKIKYFFFAIFLFQRSLAYSYQFKPNESYSGQYMVLTAKYNSVFLTDLHSL